MDKKDIIKYLENLPRCYADIWIDSIIYEAYPNGDLVKWEDINELIDKLKKE
jgi:hypothetical protein